MTGILPIKFQEHLQVNLQTMISETAPGIAVPVQSSPTYLSLSVRQSWRVEAKPLVWLSSDWNICASRQASQVALSHYVAGKNESSCKVLAVTNICFTSQRDSSHGNQIILLSPESIPFPSLWTEIFHTKVGYKVKSLGGSAPSNYEMAFIRE